MSDLVTLSLGCGIQSSTIAEMIVEAELPRIDFAIFADTGDEPDYVYAQRDHLQDRLDSINIPVITVKKNELLVDSIFRKRGRFASIPAYTKFEGNVGMMRRQCTREYKIDPIEKFIRLTLLDRKRAKKTKSNQIRVDRDVSVISWIGISLDEAMRMKTNRTKWIENRWPLISKKMTRLDCANWLAAHNLPIPEKSACRICPFHSAEYWRSMKESRPEDWEHVIKVDEHLRAGNNFSAGMRGEMFLYRDAIPLKDVDFSQADQQTNFFEICDGYCFI